MKRDPRVPRPPLAVLPVTSQLGTLREWMELAERVYAEAGRALGQVATNAHDEAL